MRTSLEPYFRRSVFSKYLTALISYVIVPFNQDWHNSRNQKIPCFMELFNFLSDTLGVSSMCLLCLVCSSKILTIDVSTGKVNWLLTCQYLHRIV